MSPVELLTIILILAGLAALRFGLPLLGIWLINKGCCALQKLMS